MTDTSAPAADWYPDPSGRFQFRYWDGQAWTGHVSTDGATDWDPPAESPEAVQTGGAGAADAAAQAGPGQADAAAGEAAAEAPAEAEAVGPEEDAAPAAHTDGADEDAASGDDLSATQQVSSEQQAEALAAVQQAEADGRDAVWAPQPEPAGTPAAEPPATPEDAEAAIAEPADTNVVAIEQAPIAQDVAEWLRVIASQVEPRLTRIAPGWGQAPQAEAARACAFGLLLGHLASRYDHMGEELSAVAEAHPSFTTLEAGSRLETLRQIADDPARAAAWLGPLVGVEDPARIRRLFD